MHGPIVGVLSPARFPVLLSWLRPYNNGTLPNAKVRSELVGLLRVLQLETTNDYVRERLEESELGKIIMFYYKNSNESSELCLAAVECRQHTLYACNRFLK